MVIYNPDGDVCTPKMLADHANAVHRQSGGKGNVFSRSDYAGSCSRIGGTGHCCCAKNSGVFDLKPIDSDIVKEGGKAYMRCRICGAWSHL